MLIKNDKGSRAAGCQAGSGGTVAQGHEAALCHALEMGRDLRKMGEDRAIVLHKAIRPTLYIYIYIYIDMYGSLSLYIRTNAV